MPVRIQRKRTKGWKMPANTIYVGRGSKYGNPFKVGYSGYLCLPKEIAGCVDIIISAIWQDSDGVTITPEVSVKLFRIYLALMKILEPKQYQQILAKLRGKNVCCWCGLDEICHGDIWLELANQEVQNATVSN